MPWPGSIERFTQLSMCRHRFIPWFGCVPALQLELVQYALVDHVRGDLGRICMHSGVQILLCALPCLSCTCVTNALIWQQAGGISKMLYEFCMARILSL